MLQRHVVPSELSESSSPVVIGLFCDKSPSVVLGQTDPSRPPAGRSQKRWVVLHKRYAGPKANDFTVRLTEATSASAYLVEDSNLRAAPCDGDALPLS